MARASGPEKVQVRKGVSRKCKRRRLGKREAGGPMQVYSGVAMVTRRWLNRALFSLDKEVKLDIT